MSIVTAQRANELISQAPWSENEVLRVFWLQVDGSREEMAAALRTTKGKEEIFAVIVRDDSFKIANRVLTDMSLLLESCRAQLEDFKKNRPEKITVVVLMKESFSKAQIGSPITLPTWFPIRPGLHTHFYLTDLVGLASGTLLSGPEAQIDHVAELIFNLEQALVNSLQALQADRAMQAHAFICILLDKESVDMSRVTADYQAHLSTIIMPRGYRPNASKNTKSIVTDMLRIFLSKNIDNLAKAAKNLGLHMPIGERLLKPSYLAVTLRPRGDYTTSERNWFSILVGIYQSYQIMNAAAHSGDYGMYPPALVHYNSCDLQLFLEDAHALFAYG